MRSAGACAITSPNAALSYTVFHGSKPKCWNTIATPAGGPATGSPPTSSSPPVISVSPAMQRRKVVLPQPLGPTMQRISLSRTARFSWRNATTVPSRNILLALRATTASVSCSAAMVTCFCLRQHRREEFVLLRSKLSPGLKAQAAERRAHRLDVDCVSHHGMIDRERAGPRRRHAEHDDLVVHQLDPGRCARAAG